MAKSVLRKPKKIVIPPMRPRMIRRATTTKQVIAKMKAKSKK